MALQIDILLVESVTVFEQARSSMENSLRVLRDSPNIASCWAGSFAGPRDLLFPIMRPCYVSHNLVLLTAESHSSSTTTKDLPAHQPRMSNNADAKKLEAELGIPKSMQTFLAAWRVMMHLYTAGRLRPPLPSCVTISPSAETCRTAFGLYRESRAIGGDGMTIDHPSEI